MEMQEKINRDYINGNSIHWGIIDKQTNSLAGTCGYYRGFESGTGEIGCVLLPGATGKGFMTKAIKLAVDFGINTIELKRIMAITNKENTRAVQLMLRLGFLKVADLDNNQVEFEFPTPE